MKRRKFMKYAGIGLEGLIGMERLVKAIAGNLTNEEGILASCDDSGGDHICRSRDHFRCDPNGVTCSGAKEDGYMFECKNYECANAPFTCWDYRCRESLSGDFNCYNDFTCMGGVEGGQFYCEGRDPFNAQFNCNPNFDCDLPEKFRCDDVWCPSTQSQSAYVVPIIPSES